MCSAKGGEVIAYLGRIFDKAEYKTEERETT